MIARASGLRVYLACGITDMRKGMTGLAMLVQQALAEDPFGGAVFAFRGRRAGLVKLIWHDGVGLCMLPHAAGAGPVRVAISQHDGQHCVEFGAAGCPAGLVRVAGAGTPTPTGTRRVEKRRPACRKTWHRRGSIVHRRDVQIDTDTLPNDPALLQQMLRTAVHQQGELHAENDKLRLLIQRLTRHQFGRRSEQLTADQLQFGLEELEQTVAENQAGQDAGGAGPQPAARATRPLRNPGALPAHLPRYEVVIDAEHAACPCCGGTMHSIGDLCTEQLDIVPAQLRVRVTRRPRYACRSCEGGVVVAPAPERPIDGGMATEALIAHLLVSKFCDSLPLYRQSQMLARQGITLDRSTLSNWVGRACWWLSPLYDLVVSTVLS